MGAFALTGNSCENHLGARFELTCLLLRVDTAAALCTAVPREVIVTIIQNGLVNTHDNAISNVKVDSPTQRAKFDSS